MFKLYRTLKSYIKNPNGFTLIEAIIATVILGIIIVPLSTIYLGSINDTIQAREQLKANQVAQLYVENLKVRSYEDFYEVFSGGNTVTYNAATISAGLYEYGLPSVTEGYTIELTKDDTIYEDKGATTGPSFEVSRDTSAEVEVGEVDMVLFLKHDSTWGNYVEVNRVINSAGDLQYIERYIMNDNHSYVVEMNVDDTKFELIDPIDTLQTDDVTITDDTRHDVMVVCEILETDVNNVFLELLVNELEESKETTVYVFRESDKFLNPLVTVGAGIVVSEYNIKQPNYATHFLTNVIVNVYTDQGFLDGEEPLASSSSTIVFD